MELTKEVIVVDIKRAIYIYVNGYSTHSDYSLKNWFEARDVCRANPKAYSAFVKQIKHGIN